MGDANPLTIAFTNRPLHESAVVPNSKVIAALEPNVKNPVNAALVHATEKGGHRWWAGQRHPASR